MVVHIIGAGPTGMALAWELAHHGDHEVVVYDRKPSAGGSWWEPTLAQRDLHAHRILFDNAWVNAHNLFTEMGMDWNALFEKHQDQVFGYMFKTLEFRDYLALLTLPFVAREDRTLKAVLQGRLSPSGEKFMEHLPLVIDGVTWDTMSSLELVQSVNHVAFSGQWTQRVSGKVMCDQMQRTLEETGKVSFKFEVALESLTFSKGDDNYVATLSDGTKLTKDLLVLCVDHSPAIKLVDENWGPDASQRIHDRTYGCINLLLDYPGGAPEVPDDLQVAVETPWKLQPRVLSDGKTLSCVICHLTEEILTSDPETLKMEVVNQLKVPPPEEVRIGWGSTWNGRRWTFDQSAGLRAGLPFFGACTRVALCGMMSARKTPYASLEAAVEVARRFSHEHFGTRQPLDSLRISHVLVIVFIILLTSRYARIQS